MSSIKRIQNRTIEQYSNNQIIVTSYKSKTQCTSKWARATSWCRPHTHTRRHIHTETVVGYGYRRNLQYTADLPKNCDHELQKLMYLMGLNILWLVCILFGAKFTIISSPYNVIKRMILNVWKWYYKNSYSKNSYSVSEHYGNVQC